jgi:DNA repair photolyase
LRILGATKKHPLSRGTIGCVGEVETLNVSRGCGASCAFCYARCYPGAPDPGTVLLYQDLPAMLRVDLDNPRRKRPPPRFVALATACDAFVGGEALIAVSRACLEILLHRGIGVSFSTRGTIPDDILQLLADHRPLVQISIPLVSLDDDYTRGWEAGSALPSQRLFQIQRLQQAELGPTIRVEPLIPFVNDRTEDLHRLMSAIAGLGIDRAYTSLLHLRPGVADQIFDQAPRGARRLVLGCFPTLQSGRPSSFDYVEPQQALAGLRRVQRIGREHQVRVSACRCQSPGLPAARCPVVPQDLPERSSSGEQRELFDDA